MGKYSKGASGTIYINGSSNDQKISIPVEINLPEENLSHSILGTIWAREKIASLSRSMTSNDPAMIEQITELGIQHHLLTPYTSFIAVDSSKIISDGATPTIEQPAPSPEAQSAAATGSLVGNIKGSGAMGSPFASVFGRENEENALGGLYGGRPGGDEGGFGMGLRGTGTGEGTVGKGRGGFGGRSTNAPDVVEGKAEVKGSLDKDIIRRVIRRAMPGIKFCYEQALLTAPTLAGKIKVFFVIAANGAVSSASTTKGIDKEVDACVARKISQLSFPAPQGGGIVEVTYPFTFSPAK